MRRPPYDVCKIKVGFGENDTKVVMEAFKRAATVEELLATISLIEGPFAFVYFEVCLTRLLALTLFPLPTAHGTCRKKRNGCGLGAIASDGVLCSGDGQKAKARTNHSYSAQWGLQKEAAMRFGKRYRQTLCFASSLAEVRYQRMLHSKCVATRSNDTLGRMKAVYLL